MATKKTQPNAHAQLLAKVIEDACAADAIYQSCQPYPFRLFVSSLIHRKDVQEAVAACLEGADNEGEVQD